MTSQKNNGGCASGKFTRFTKKELQNLSANRHWNSLYAGLTGVIRNYRRLDDPATHMFSRTSSIDNIPDSHNNYFGVSSLTGTGRQWPSAIAYK